MRRVLASRSNEGRETDNVVGNNRIVGNNEGTVIVARLVCGDLLNIVSNLSFRIINLMPDGLPVNF